MKRIIKRVFAITYLALLLSQIGCGNKSDNNGNKEVYIGRRIQDQERGRSVNDDETRNCYFKKGIYLC